jgi:hypothetical protein
MILGPWRATVSARSRIVRAVSSTLEPGTVLEQVTNAVVAALRIQPGQGAAGALGATGRLLARRRRGGRAPRAPLEPLELGV